MSKFVGAWLVSSSATAPVRNLALDVTDNTGLAWPSAVGTGYTLALEIHKAGAAAVFDTLAGSWEDVGDTSNPTTLFPIGTLATIIPATLGDEILYECYIVLTKASIVERYGFSDANEPFGFTVKRVA